MRIALVLAASLALTGAAAGPERYQIDAEISIDGQRLGTPRMFVDEGMPATVQVAGANGYRFVAIVSPDSRSGLKRLHTEIARPAANGGWHIVARPQVLFSPDRPLATGGKDGPVRYSLAVLRR